MSTTHRPHGGFTLVELLTVIVIIGMLAGLLVPAVLSSRASARQTQCINNQKEICSLLRQYEGDKQRFPALRKVRPGGNPTVATDYVYNWAVELLPYVGRNDLWETGNWRDKPRNVALVTPAAQIDLYVCPTDDDPGYNGVMPRSSGAGLSYGVNLHVVRDAADVSYVWPLGGITYTVAARNIRLENIKSQDTTPLISERSVPAVDPDPSTPAVNESPLNARVGPTWAYWAAAPTSAIAYIGQGEPTAPDLPSPAAAAPASPLPALPPYFARGLSFIWYYAPPTDQVDTIQSTGIVHGNHPGGTVVGFASGRVALVPTSTALGAYLTGPN